MNINLLAIDIAKNVFQLHGIDQYGNPVLKKCVSRNKLMEVISNIPYCTIVMESCGGASYWSRKFQSLNYAVKLIAPQFVKPFVKTNKNDANDAEAIAEAASRPTMEFVSSKNVEQQDIQSIHRIRTRLVHNRTALVNQIRGILLEYGIAIPQGIAVVYRNMTEILEDSENELTLVTREFISDLYDELKQLDIKIKSYEQDLQKICRGNEACQKIIKICGIGVMTATAVVAAVGSPSQFKNGRHMSAWLGLVPKQHSSGNKRVLLGISKRGNKYIRCLLIHGARAAICSSKSSVDPNVLWAKKKGQEAGINKACVALANKNTRIIWAILSSKEAYRYSA